MQIKTTVRYHYIHIIMPKPRTLITPSVGKAGSNWNFYVTDGNVKWNNSGKQFRIYYKLKTYLSYDVAFPHLSIYPREMKAYDHTETCV